MDGQLAIEWNAQALKRILLTLVAMAGLDGRTTLSRHLNRAILCLLRPAESATRRLVIALARKIEVTLPVRRPRKPKIALRQIRHFKPMRPVEPSAPTRPRIYTLPLLDPPRRGARRRWIRQMGIPCISMPGFTGRISIPARLPPSPLDQVDATRLGLRLTALGRALDDLPRRALRFARWRARKQRAADLLAAAPQNREIRAKLTRTAFRRPLKWGRAPGLPQRPRHEVHHILAHAHELAVYALRPADTS